MATNNNINYTPAPIPGTVTAPVLGNNIDRAPAPVAPGAGTGYVPVVTQPVVVVTEQPVINPPIPAARNSVVVPVAEQPVAAQVAAESTLGPNITASNQQRYITILSNGTVVTNNTSTLDFEGNGFTITSSGVNGAVISINAAAGGYGNSNVSTLLAAFGSNTIVTTGNITGGYILGNGSQLTGLAATYGNANVAANLAAFGSNPISTTGNITGGNILGGANVNATTHTGTTVSVSANITGGNLLTGGLISATGNITGGNLLTGGLFSATGNITGSYFIGNGSALTGIVANTTYGNSNVVTLLAGYGSNVISTTGNVTAGSFVGNVVGGGAGTPTISSATNLDLSAASAVRVIGGGTFRLPSLTTAQIANTIAANGDMIYNSSVNKFQGYENSAWANII